MQIKIFWKPYRFCLYHFLQRARSLRSNAKMVNVLIQVRNATVILIVQTIAMSRIVVRNIPYNDYQIIPLNKLFYMMLLSQWTWLFVFIATDVSCGDQKLYPSCSHCENDMRKSPNLWCNGNCKFDEDKGTCENNGNFI